MRIILLITTFLCALLYNSYGQPSLPNTPSPTVLSYGKYADIQPNLYNGAISVPIPITTLSEGTLQLPISLQYHTAGIRAYELASPVGLGWTLQAGGAITRQVRGLADDDPNYGYFITGAKATDGHISNQDWEDFKNQQLDGESDIYAYNFGGYSGKFVMTQNQQCIPVPNSDISITYNANTFTITTPDGVRYFFGGTFVEKTTIGTKSHNSAFFLRQIISPDTHHSISLAYKSDQYRYYSVQDCQKRDAADCEMSASLISVSTYNLSSVTTSTSSIQLNYTGRSDLVPNSNGSLGDRLRSIDVTEGGIIKTFTFNHAYFYDSSNKAIPAQLDDDINDNHNDELKRRLKLNSISITGSDGSYIPDYSFEYYGLNATGNGAYFPSQVTMAIDHWGFYNGLTTNGDHRNIIPFTTIQNDNGQTISSGGRIGDIRQSSFNHMVAGSLKKINFPLGGSTEFEYQANQYFDASATSHQHLLTSQGSQALTLNFNQFQNGTIIIDANANSNSTCRDLGSYVFRIENSIGQEIYRSNKIVYQHNSFRQLLSNIPGINPYSSYTFFLENIDCINAISLDIEWSGSGEPMACGGLRLARMTTDDGDSDNSNNIIRDYQYGPTTGTGAGTGVLFRKPNYGFFGRTTTNQEVAIFSSHAIGLLSSFEGYHIGYKNVTIDYNGNGSKTTYFTTRAAQDRNQYFPAPPETQWNGEFGQMQYSAITTEDGTNLQSTQQQYVTEIDQSVGQNMVALAYVDDGNIRAQLSYSINTGIIRPRQTQQTVEGINTTTDYIYDFDINSTPEHLYPIEITTRDQEGAMISQQNIVYTPNYFSPSGLSTSSQTTDLKNYFTLRNIIRPFLTVNRKYGLLTSREYTDYIMRLENGLAFFNARPKRHTVEHIDLDNLGQSVAQRPKDITYFDSYDGEGQLTAMRPANTPYTKTFDYYPNHTLKNTCTVGGGENHCTQWQYLNDDSRLIETVIDIDGTQTDYTYDGLHRLHTTTDCTGATTTLHYHPEAPQPYTEIVQSFLPDAYGLSDLQEIKSRTYQDGLGRTIQTVGIQQTQDGYDQIQATAYDNQGRPYRQYETIESSNANGAYVTPQNQWPYTLTTYEPSPLNRKASTTPPNWNNKTTQYTYGLNTAHDAVIKNHTTLETYPANQLYKRTVIDANDNPTIQFIDQYGRRILQRHTDAQDNPQQRHDTYYQYDIKDRTIQVTPPGATRNDTILNYYYAYDAKSNLTQKIVPSKGRIDYVYNDYNLLVAQQDAMLKAQGKWYAYQYDHFNRNIVSGFHFNSNTPSTQPTIHEHLTRNVFGTTGIETAKITSQYAAILNEGITMRNDDPTQYEIQTHQYYDACGRLDYSLSNSAQNEFALDTTKYHYDGASNIVRTDYHRNDALFQATRISESSHIDDDGRTSQLWHQVNDQTPQQLCGIQYTPKDQISIKYIGGNSAQHLQQTDYDYLDNGLLHEVNKGNATITSDKLYAYTINYYQDYADDIAYPQSTAQYNGNIRSIGWKHRYDDNYQVSYYHYDHLDRLTKNQTFELNPIGLAENIGHHNTEYQYDSRGNFATVTRYENNAKIDALNYQYKDNNANQLDHIIENGQSDQGYQSKGNTLAYTYDANGNLTHDPHKGITIQYNHLDLPYRVTWQDGRRMEFIYDASGALLKKRLFNANNQMIQKHDYAGIIEYLNDKPYIIHHAEGRLLNRGAEKVLNYLFLDHEQYTDGTFKSLEIESIGDIVQQHTLYQATQCIRMEANFEVMLGSEFTATIDPVESYQENWQYHYSISDHLGNLRAEYADLNGDGDIAKNEVLQLIDYHPYGMKRRNTLNHSLKNNYQYNGIDHVDDYGLSWNMATYRSLDGAIGIWNSVDPKAEAVKSMSPYAAMGNNPISNVDPDGDLPFLAAVAIGAGVGAITGGIQGGWDGAWKGALIGGASGAASFGLGSFTSGLSTAGSNLSSWGVSNSLGTIATATNIAGHSAIGGLSSLASGGNFGSGALSGGFSSVTGLTLGGLGTGGQLAAGTISGGVGAELGGGNFWQGAGYGLISTGLNHVAHQIESNIRVRREIVRIAKSHVGSTDWNYSKSKDNFAAGTNKCNKFCYDVTTEAGGSPGLPNGNWLKKLLGYGSPPTAGQWADPNYDIPGWQVVSNPRAGDVVAYAHQYTDATGHVAIVSSRGYSIGTSGSVQAIARTTFGFNNSYLPSGSSYVYRRYVGN